MSSRAYASPSTGAGGLAPLCKPSWDHALVRVDGRVEEQAGRGKMLHYSGDRGKQRRWQRRLRPRPGERVVSVAPAGHMQMPARTLLPGHGFGKEGCPQAHRRREFLHRKLRVGGVVGGPQRWTRSEVELQQPRRSLGVYRDELDAQVVQSWPQRSHKAFEPAYLAEAVAVATRNEAIVSVPNAHLVLHGGQNVVADFGHQAECSTEDLTGGKLARFAVRPERCADADPPAAPPGQVMEGVRVRVNEQVRRARTDAEPLVIRDRGVSRVKRKQQVGHRGAVPKGRLERLWPQGLAAKRSVQVGEPEQHELDVSGLRRGEHSGGAAHSGTMCASTHSETSARVSAKRSSISSSSVSVLVSAGASRVSSPA